MTDITDQVCQDLQARAAVGERKYGTRLHPHNGRVALQDAYEEVLDLACYLRQKLTEDELANVGSCGQVSTGCQSYVVTAYRWGCRDLHSYVLGAWPSIEEACKWAEEEMQNRGGKYGMDVVVSDGTYRPDGIPASVAYFPSMKGEHAVMTQLAQNVLGKVKDPDPQSE